MTEQTTTDTPATDPTTGTDATAVDAAAQTSAEATFAPTDLVVPTESTSPAPEPEPAAAAPVAPQAITVEVDEQTKALLSQQFVTLSSSVLDAPEVASLAAKALLNYFGLNYTDRSGEQTLQGGDRVRLADANYVQFDRPAELKAGDRVALTTSVGGGAAGQVFE
jgi:hypothetical protein